MKNAIFVKFEVVVYSPMIWRAAIVRGGYGECKILADIIHDIDWHPLYAPHLFFEQADKILRDMGYVPVKDDFDVNNLADVHEARVRASKKWNELFVESLTL